MNILRKTDEKTEDDINFIENYLKKYFSQGLSEIKCKVDHEQLKKVFFCFCVIYFRKKSTKLLISTQYRAIDKDFLIKDKAIFETNFYFVLSGGQHHININHRNKIAISVFFLLGSFEVYGKKNQDKKGFKYFIFY